MNDSFLEDLQLVETDNKQVSAHPPNRHVTTRAITSTPMPMEKKFENVIQRKIERSMSAEKQSAPKKLSKKNTRYSLDDEQGNQQSRTRLLERKEKLVESKLKPIENKVKHDSKEHKEHQVKDDVKKKIEDPRIKISDSKAAGKEQKRRSGSYKENSHCSSISSKENSYQSSISRETSSPMEVCKERVKKCDCHKKPDNDPLVLLNTFKDLISTHTKEESAKILRTIKELHVNSQATLIKHLIFQTDEIIKEMHPSKDSTRMRSLMEENERLQEDVIILQKRNGDLQRKLEEFELLKQENITLKLKCKELMK